MRWYSLHTPKLVRQIIADVLAVSTIVVAFAVAGRVRDQILSYRALGADLVTTGGDIDQVMTTFAEQLRQIPFVGDTLGDSVLGGTVVPDQIISTGMAFQQAVADVASFAWGIVALVPLIGVLIAWLPWRFLFVARTVEVGKLAASEGGMDILAQRALANAPASAVLRIHPRATRAVHSDDAVRDALALLQRRVYGYGAAARVQ